MGFYQKPFSCRTNYINQTFSICALGVQSASVSIKIWCMKKMFTNLWVGWMSIDLVRTVLALLKSLRVKQMKAVSAERPIPRPTLSLTTSLDYVGKLWIGPWAHMVLILKEKCQNHWHRPAVRTQVINTDPHEINLRHHFITLYRHTFLLWKTLKKNSPQWGPGTLLHPFSPKQTS